MSSSRFRLKAAAYIILIKDNKVLLARRYNTGYLDGEFNVPSGHLDGDEPASAAAIRETREEIGIEIRPQDLQIAHVMHRHTPSQGKGFEYVDFFFTVSAWSGQPTIMEPHKCDHLEWFNVNQLPSNTVQHIKDALTYINQGQPFSEQGWPS